MDKIRNEDVRAELEEGISFMQSVVSVSDNPVSTAEAM
jgi:hypothetical protein